MLQRAHERKLVIRILHGVFGTIAEILQPKGATPTNDHRGILMAHWDRSHPACRLSACEAIPDCI